MIKNIYLVPKVYIHIWGIDCLENVRRELFPDNTTALERDFLDPSQSRPSTDSGYQLLPLTLNTLHNSLSNSPAPSFILVNI